MNSLVGPKISTNGQQKDRVVILIKYVGHFLGAASATSKSLVTGGTSLQ